MFRSSLGSKYDSLYSCEDLCLCGTDSLLLVTWWNSLTSLSVPLKFPSEWFMLPFSFSSWSPILIDKLLQFVSRVNVFSLPSFIGENNLLFSLRLSHHRSSVCCSLVSFSISLHSIDGVKPKGLNPIWLSCIVLSLKEPSREVKQLSIERSVGCVACVCWLWNPDSSFISVNGEFRHWLDALDTNSDSWTLTASNPTVSMFCLPRVSCAFSSTDCRYFPWASIRNCKCRCTYISSIRPHLEAIKEKIPWILEVWQEKTKHSFLILETKHVDKPCWLRLFKISNWLSYLYNCEKMCLDYLISRWSFLFRRWKCLFSSFCFLHQQIVNLIFYKYFRHMLLLSFLICNIIHQ